MRNRSVFASALLLGATYLVACSGDGGGGSSGSGGSGGGTTAVGGSGGAGSGGSSAKGGSGGSGSGGTSARGGSGGNGAGGSGTGGSGFGGTSARGGSGGGSGGSGGSAGGAGGGGGTTSAGGGSGGSATGGRGGGSGGSGSGGTTAIGGAGGCSCLGGSTNTGGTARAAAAPAAPRPVAAVLVAAGTGGSTGGLPPLQVNGTKLEDPSGKTIILRGSSLIDIGALYAYAGNSVKGITDRMDKLAAAGVQGHVVRFPVYPKIDYNAGYPYCSDLPYPVGTGPTTSCTAKSPMSAADYVSKVLTPAIDYATSKKLYVIIDHHQIDDATERTSAADANTFWTDIAPKYASYGNVLYEPFNEPIDGSKTWAQLKPKVQGWIDTIRNAGATNVIIVPSNSYCQRPGDAASDPPTDPKKNLMYTAHVYPGNWNARSSSRSPPRSPRRRSSSPSGASTSARPATPCRSHDVDDLGHRLPSHRRRQRRKLDRVGDRQRLDAQHVLGQRHHPAHRLRQAHQELACRQGDQRLGGVDREAATTRWRYGRSPRQRRGISDMRRIPRSGFPPSSCTGCLPGSCTWWAGCILRRRRRLCRECHQR